MTKPMKSKQKQEKEQITQDEYDKKAEARRQAMLKKKQEEIEIRQFWDTFWENCFASDREVEHYYNMIGRENFASVGTYRSYNCPFD